MGFVASVRGPIPATDLPFFSCNAASSCSQRLHVERLMEALGERRARSWDGAEDVGRLARTAQPLQIRPPSIFGDRPHGRGVPIFFAEVRPTSGAAEPPSLSSSQFGRGDGGQSRASGPPCIRRMRFSASGASVRSCPGSSDDVEPRGHGPCRGRPAVWPGRRRCMRSRCRTAALADGSPWPYRAPRRPALSGATHTADKSAGSSVSR